MTKIYFVRHCEGEGNATRRSQTLYDGLITTKGFRQCEALRDRFHDVHLDAVYSSDSYRAHVAADLVAEDHGLKPRYRKLLREYSVGVWDGLANGDVRRIFAKYLEHNNANPGDTWFPGGDTYDAIERRAAAILHEMLEEHKGETLMVLSHAYMLQILLNYVAGYPREESGRISYGDNTAVSLVVEEEGKLHIEFMGDVSHLTPELQRSFSTGDRAAMDMPTYGLDLNEHRQLLVEMDAKLRQKRGLPAQSEEECVAAALARTAQNRDYVTFFYQLGEPVGMIYMRRHEALDDEHAFAEDWYMDDARRGKEYDLQMLGHAIHTARKENRRYLAIRKPDNEADRLMVERFFFEEIPGHSDLLRLDVIPPACQRPVI
ncbi:MAG: histidine phosphatase family protein [Ruminococcaceae bacterium]|nr:histidine phosphatase family protein [Oscillospiraceae bacterium]